MSESLGRLDFNEYRTVSANFFVSVTRVLSKHFGNELIIPLEMMEQIRQCAAILEAIGERAVELQKDGNPLESTLQTETD